MSARLHIACLALLLIVGAGTLGSQTPAPEDQTAVKAARLRDAFVQRIHSLGLACPLAPPAILVEDVPSFGNYEKFTNTLHTSDWKLLRPEEKALSVQLAGTGADETATREVFEKVAHGWILVHELGHWWQACTGSIGNRTPYELEYGANRIALAYWRESNPSISTLMSHLFHQVLNAGPSPVARNMTVEAYFNEFYKKLGPTPAYFWFQARMGVTLEQEEPAPTFKESLAAKTPPPRAVTPIPDVNGLYKIGEGVSAPVVLFQPEPVFPMIAAGLHFRPASMMFSLIVQTDGCATNITLLRSSGGGVPEPSDELKAVILAYDKAALEAIRHYKFRPATLNGRPVPVAMNVETFIDSF